MRSFCSSVVLLFVIAVIPAYGQSEISVPAELQESREEFFAKVNDLHQNILTAFLDYKLDAIKRGDLRAGENAAEDVKAFQETRSLPKWLDTPTRKSYLSGMDQACTVVTREWDKEIKKIARSGKDGEAFQLEVKLGQMLTNARGYGLAMPSVDVIERIRFRLRNVGTGMVMESGPKRSLLLSPTAKRPEQVFKFLLFKSEVAIKNTKTNRVLNIPRRSKQKNLRISFYSKSGKEPNEKWKPIEDGRQLTLQARNKLVLAADQDKESGQWIVVQQDDTKRPSQRWTLEILQ